MSMIGSFGLCPYNDYHNLLSLITDNSFDKAEELITRIYNELEISAQELENGKCSGEVFIALFEYFQTSPGINVHKNKDLAEIWTRVTGDYYVAVFSGETKTEFASALPVTGYNKIIEFTNAFFQNDYGEAVQTACTVFLNNLEKITSDNILIFHMF